MTTLGAFAAIFNDGKILLVEQAYPPYRWTQPGGRIEKGETAEVAVRREVKEETNLDVDVDHLIGIYHAVYKDDVVFHFRCSVAEFDLRCPELEIRQARFFAQAELPANLAYNTRTRIDDAFLDLRPQLRVFASDGHLSSSFFATKDRTSA